MTDYEIRKKIEQRRVSDAKVEVKAKAISEPEKKLTSSKDTAYKQFIESLAEPSDIGYD